MSFDQDDEVFYALHERKAPPLPRRDFVDFIANGVEDALIARRDATLMIAALAPPPEAQAVDVEAGLEEAARIFSLAIRAADRVSRVSATEIAIFLNDCEAKDAPAAAWRLRRALDYATLPFGGDRLRFGAASAEAYDADPEVWIETARSDMRAREAAERLT